MASLGTMSLKTVVSNDGLVSGLEQAKNAAKGAAGEISGVMATVSKGALAGIAAAVTAATTAIYTGLSKIKEVAGATKTANTLGIDPREFQVLQQYLRRGGIEIEQTGDFLADMSRKFTQAANGSARMQRVFQALGIDAQAFRDADAGEQIDALAEGFKRLGPGMEAAGLASQLGISTQLLGVLQRGEEGYKKFKDELLASGAIMTSAESQRAMEAQRQWNKAKESLGRAWESLGTAMGVAMTPLLEKMAEVLQFVANKLKPIFEQLGTAIKNASNMWQDLQNGTLDIMLRVWEGISGQKTPKWLRDFLVEDRTGQMALRNSVTATADNAQRRIRQIAEPFINFRKDNPAIIQGTAEAAKVEASWQGLNTIGETNRLSREQLQALLDMQRKLDNIEKNTRGHADIEEF